jgi:phosphate transport system permease protein
VDEGHRDMAAASPRDFTVMMPPRSPLTRFKERVISGVLMLSLLSVIIPVVLIVVFLLTKGAPGLSWQFITQEPAQRMTAGGIRPVILGSLYLVSLTALFSVPIGVLAAVYLTEYAKKSFVTRAIRLAIVNLAGVPSIVYGLFGLGLFVYFLNFGTSLLAASCTLAVLVLPLIITASEEALLTVPAAFREASLALGVSKWQTIWRVVLPTATPGILTGIILGVARAAGETAPLLFCGAAFFLSFFPESFSVARIPSMVHDTLTSQFMALPYHLYTLATQVPKASETLKWATALVLLILVLGMNMIAILLRSYLRRARRW